ncbi:HlyD family secretion protein [Psychromonas ossibalaenae]|uniref:HlyD family secretion protein n=1 Tax=Psychromonas ossibalaenae TaxID=444922 RepID=UPI00037034F5|nr:HlyD family secretion protein [Psychromonas ossibalaenae]
MNNKIKTLLTALILSGCAAAVYYTFALQANRVKTENAYVHGEITQISAEASGRITKILISDNQLVQAGELLAVIDDRDYIAHRDQARAALAVVKAALANNLSRIELQELNIKQASAQLDTLQAEDKLQRSELLRYSRLVKTGAVSQTRYELQKTTTTKAAANLEAGKFTLAASKQTIQTLQSERAQIIAQQQQAAAGLALSELALQDTKIRAPITGVVGNRSLQVGKFVKAGTGILAIVPVDELWLNANYKETQLTNVKPGQAVDVLLDMFPGKAIKGRVSSISPSTGTQFSLLPPDNSTGNFVKVVQRVTVKIELDIPQELQGRVVPGLSAQVVIHAATTGV